MSEPQPQPTRAEIEKTMRGNRRLLSVSRNWIVIALVFLFVYTGLSLTAPVFMKLGMEGPANVIYRIYSPMCHQFAFRSWFFFGDQVAYPRETAGSNLDSFEDYAARDEHFDGVNLSDWSDELMVKARTFHGNEEMGYKTALCERDVAIYLAMFLAGLAFIPVRDWLRPAPIWLYLILGLGPIGLDGTSQLFSYPPLEMWPVRETIPVFRAATGALFGIMNVWLAFPYIERSVRETITELEEKLAFAEQQLVAVDREQ
ncbi:MAG: DUF2085 domain-containing protein [Chloroflexi bacterium]|nr:DUF2085 domain-containing protein [Chloroflexota bacterium]